MSEILYTGTLSGSDLTQLISGCNFQQNARFLGEQLPTRIVDETERQNLLLFDWYSPAIEFTRYNTGRIFYQDAELRWERNVNQFHIVYLGNAQPAAILEHYQCKAHDKWAGRTHNQKLQPKQTSYILYGSFLNSNIRVPEHSVPYAEARIPRILYYPFDLQQADQSKRLSIRALEYIDAESGHIFVYRFQSLDVVEPTNLK